MSASFAERGRWAFAVRMNRLAVGVVLAMPGERGIPLGGGSVDGSEFDFAGAGAAFEEGRHLHAPVGGGLGEVGGGHFDVGDFLGLLEGLGGDFGADGRGGAKGGRRAGSGVRCLRFGGLAGERGGQQAEGTEGDELSARGGHLFLLKRGN